MKFPPLVLARNLMRKSPDGKCCVALFPIKKTPDYEPPVAGAGSASGAVGDPTPLPG